MPAIEKIEEEDETRPSHYPLELEALRDEWIESRKSIDRFDKITIDVRKYGFSLIALIISSSTIIFDAAAIKNPLPLIIVPFVVGILTLAVYLADSYYQVLLLSTVLHSRQLENVHKEILSRHVRQQTYFGWNITNYVEDKIQKSKAYLNAFVIYILFLSIAFLMGYFSLLSFKINTHNSPVEQYIYILSASFLVALLFLVLNSRSVHKLLKEMQESEIVDNRFVIRKLYARDEITSATKRVAGEIYKTYKDTNFKILTLGMGGLYFANNLISQLKKKNMINVELISAFSERKGDEVSIQPPQRSDVEGENILIIDDLASSGITMQTAIEICYALGAETVRTGALLDAPRKRSPDAKELNLDFVGIRSTERNRFFVGSGLDGGERMSPAARDRVRHLPYIGVIVAPLDYEFIRTQGKYSD
jgi:hypoxanthine phosphoribosyltransferase